LRQRGYGFSFWAKISFFDPAPLNSSGLIQVTYLPLTQAFKRVKHYQLLESKGKLTQRSIHLEFLAWIMIGFFGRGLRAISGSEG